MRLTIGLLALALVLVVAGAAALVLQSCGLRLPFSDRVILTCPPAETRAEADARRVAGQARTLETRIAALEQQLAGLECTALPPPPPDDTPSGLAPDAFRDNDISIMEGCWELQSEYNVRHIRTGEITSFRDWRICFDAAGNGREEMRATNGVSCEGQLSGRIGSGQLSMAEPGNLICSNGFEIFRRDITCSLDAQGVANCSTYQPEIDGRGTATLRRAGRE